MSEWTATVRIASRRQVRMTRPAISPRLAIRIFENMGVPRSSSDARRRLVEGDFRRLRRHPRGLALLEERRHAFAPLGRGAQLGDALGGVLDELARHGAIVHRADQLLGFAL